MDFTHPVEALVPGAQGRVLAVLVSTTAELNVRTIAQLAGVSKAQVSRLLPSLVELGVVARRDVPPSSLFRLVDEHVLSRALRDLAGSRRRVLSDMGDLAAAMPVPPISVIVFGSLSRGTAERDSDIDVVVVRPGSVDEDDLVWSDALGEWSRAVRRLTGNAVDVLEVDGEQARARLGR